MKYADNSAGDDQAARKHDAMRRISTVQQILRRWDPIGVRPGESAPADEYDSYAPHIVSMVAQGCSLEQLCTQLEGIRVDTMGVGPDPATDREIATEILQVLRGSAV
jgi:hypothetical protein